MLDLKNDQVKHNTLKCESFNCSRKVYAEGILSKWTGPSN